MLLDFPTVVNSALNELKPVIDTIATVLRLAFMYHLLTNYCKILELLLKYVSLYPVYSSDLYRI